MSTFESFLRECLDHGHTQIKLVPRRDENYDGAVYFYATGQCGSETCEDFNGSVEGDDICGPEITGGPPAAEDLLTELEQRADEEAEASRAPTKKSKKAADE